jgi:hypothetical protein
MVHLGGHMARRLAHLAHHLAHMVPSRQEHGPLPTTTTPVGQVGGMAHPLPTATGRRLTAMGRRLMALAASHQAWMALGGPHHTPAGAPHQAGGVVHPGPCSTGMGGHHLGGRVVGAGVGAGAGGGAGVTIEAGEGRGAGGSTGGTGGVEEVQKQYRMYCTVSVGLVLWEGCVVDQCGRVAPRPGQGSRIVCLFWPWCQVQVPYMQASHEGR